MKYLKSFERITGLDQINYGEVSNIIEDYRTEFKDLDLDVSGVTITTYSITDDKLINCVYFNIETTLDHGTDIILQCYDILVQLRTYLHNECGLDISIEVHSEIPLLDIDTAVEIYGPEDYTSIGVYIHPPFDRSEIELDEDESDED